MFYREQFSDRMDCEEDDVLENNCAFFYIIGSESCCCACCSSPPSCPFVVNLPMMMPETSDRRRVFRFDVVPSGTNLPHVGAHIKDRHFPSANMSFLLPMAPSQSCMNILDQLLASQPAPGLSRLEISQLFQLNILQIE